MHATFPARPRAVRLLAITFALGLVLAFAPLPTYVFEATASAELSPVGSFQPVSTATLATQQQAAEGTVGPDRVSSVTDRTDDFNMIGVALPDAPSEPVLVRVLDAHGAWSEWNELEVDADKGPDAGTAEATAEVPSGGVVSEPLWVGDATGYEVSVGEADAAGVEVAVVREHTRRVVQEAVPLAEAAAPAPFGIHSRASWGARAPKNNPSIASGGLKLAVVHHTAGSNNYSAAQVPGIIRSMQAFHMDGNRWSDLGYNFVVDKFGRIWEGRAGGTSRAVVGAHAAGFNTGSVGVSVIGNYTGVSASSAAREAVSQIVGYRLQNHGVDPRGRVNFTSGGSSTIPAGRVVNLPRVIGHRDVGATGCPGTIYGNLGSIRTRAGDWFTLMEALVSPAGSIEAVRVNGNRIDVLGWATDPDATSPPRVHVVVAGRLREVLANRYHGAYRDHRAFTTAVTGLPAGTHRLCVTVINQGAGNDKLLGCRDVVIK